jgi:hypothetical protein
MVRLKPASAYRHLRPGNSTGALSALPRSPFPAQFIATSIALVPSGKFLYAGIVGVATISGFSVDSKSGVLTPRPGLPFQGGNPSVLARYFGGVSICDWRDGGHTFGIPD